jgi:hypothetical protein
MTERTPSSPHLTRNGKHADHDYEVGFYAGFASRIQLQTEGKEPTVLYHQGQNGEERTFVLPNGAIRPHSSHALQLISTTKGFTVALHIDDPQHVIQSISVTLRDPAPQPHFDPNRLRPGANGEAPPLPSAGGTDPTAQEGVQSGGVTAFQGGGGTTWTTDNTPTICPPTC